MSAITDTIDAERRGALDDVRRTRRELTEANEAYSNAVVRAHELGISNRRIAQALGYSETAIRLFLKRRTERLGRRSV